MYPLFQRSANDEFQSCFSDTCAWLLHVNDIERQIFFLSVAVTVTFLYFILFYFRFNCMLSSLQLILCPFNYAFIALILFQQKKSKHAYIRTVIDSMNSCKGKPSQPFGIDKLVNTKFFCNCAHSNNIKHQ